jgi:hypothetical protein
MSAYERSLAAFLDPLRPIAPVPQCNGLDPRMLELANKDTWTKDDWAYALMREAEGDAS